MDEMRNKHGLWLELASFSVIDLSGIRVINSPVLNLKFS